MDFFKVSYHRCIICIHKDQLYMGADGEADTGEEVGQESSTEQEDEKRSGGQLQHERNDPSEGRKPYDTLIFNYSFDDDQNY